MPWAPTDRSKTDQVRQFYAQRPDLAEALQDKSVREDLAAKLREAGIEVQEYDLTDPDILAELGRIEDPELEKIFPFTQDSIADKRRAYYDRNPEQDPQSYASYVLEALGLDEPYYNDSRSWDYIQKKANLAGDNPDMSWFLQPTEAQEQVMTGSMPSIFGQPDERTTEDQVSGHVLGLLNFPFYGAEDEAVAGLGAAAGRDYEAELERARSIKNQHELHAPIWSQVPEMVGGVLLSLPGYAVKRMLAARGLQAGRQAAGMSPKATSEAGKAVESFAPDAPAAAAASAAYQLGEANGDFQERVDKFNPYEAAMFAGFPLGATVVGATIGAAKDGVAKGRQLFRRHLAGKRKLNKSGKFKAKSATVTDETSPPPAFPGIADPAPRPGLPRRPDIAPAPTVRSDINRALQNSQRRR